jgi:DNA-binding transcriptional LysR family regulator
MELLDLHYLIVTADAGKFALAAKVLEIDTSTVSRRIGNLEDELGLSIFERDHAGIRLTRGGQVILRCARRILFHTDELKRIGQKFASGSSGEIRLGVRLPPVGGASRALLTAWRIAHPEVSLSVIEGNERELALGLGERRLDAALVTGRTMWPHVSACTLFRERLIAVLPDNHPLAQRQTLDWECLSLETTLIQDWDDNHTQREFFATLLGNGARFQTHTASKQTIMALVGAGLGITLATDSQAEATLPGITFRPIDEDNASLEFDLVWLPETEDPLVGRFIAFMRDESRLRGYV